MPFYQTVNVLAHANYSGVKYQLEVALGRIDEQQSNDGTWGPTDSEWNNFLVVHALRNKDLL